MAESLGTIRAQMVLDVRQAIENFTAVRNANLTTVTALRTGGATLALAGAGMAAVGAGMLSALGSAITAAADFERQLDFFGAVSASTAEEMDAVREAAILLGQDTIYSAGQIADSFVELGKAGVGAEDIINGIGEAVANLGAAADIPLDTAANIMLSAVQTFGLASEDAVHVADLLAGAANASIVEVEDLGVSLKYAGGTANALGIPLEDVIDALGLLGTYGIKGSTAGTSLRQTMLSLGGTTKAAKDELKALGIITEDGTNRFYDAEGNAKSLSEVFQILNEATDGMSAAQKTATFRTIFQTRAMSTALALTKSGADGFANMNEEISKTTAMEVASARLDNLSGDVEILRGNLETLAIDTGSKFQEFLRGVVQGLTNMVQWFTNLNPNVQTALIWFVAISGVLLVVLGFVTALAGSLLVLTAAWTQIQNALVLIRGAMGAVTVAQWALNSALLANPITWIVLAIIALIAVFVLLWKNNEGFRNFFINMWEWIKNAAGAVVDWFRGLPKWFSDTWEKIKTTTSNLWNGIIDFFKSIPEKIMNFFLNWTLPGLLIQHWDTIWETIKTAWNNILTFFQELPGRIANFFAELPNKVAYWIGFMVGWVLAKLIEFGTAAWEFITTAWNNIITFFSELPGKVLAFFQQMRDWAVDKILEMSVWVYNTANNIYNSVIDWFKKLPGRVRDFFVQMSLWAYNKFQELKNKAITTATNLYNGIVDWVKKLPGRVLDFFTTVYTNVKNKFNEVKDKAVEIAINLYNGLVEEITGIPDKVKQIFLDAIESVTNLASDAWDAVKEFGSNMWEGFKDGMGIHSPSYIERAMWQVTDTLDDELKNMRGQVRTIQGLGNGISEPSFGIDGSQTARSLELLKNQVAAARDYQDQLAGIAASSSSDISGASSMGANGSSPVIVKSGNQVTLQVEWNASSGDGINNKSQVNKLLAQSADILNDNLEDDDE